MALTLEALRLICYKYKFKNQKKKIKLKIIDTAYQF